MSGGGGKGGSQTTTVEIDPRLEELGVATGVGALRTAALPVRPNRGVQIAAFTPQQLAGMQGASAASAALGLPSAGLAPMPKPETNAMGIQGYSPAYAYDEMVDRSMSPSDLQAQKSIRDYYSRKADEIERKPRKMRSSGGGGGK